ncbi:MAG: AAA family ATPase [Candidatus Pacebacteria bacterium]|nr:AAA family ATPase [Candidatus Paceibacterota bacterium]
MKIVKFIKWKYWDFRNPQPKKPFGIIAFVGLPGQGKTLSMVELLDRTKELYPKLTVGIYTNFGYKGQAGRIKNMQDIIDTPANSIIAIDETQTIFSSRDWQNFPAEMLSVVTQHRKKAKQLLFTGQRFGMLDKNLRELCNFIVECRCLMGRWFFQKAYLFSDYEKLEGQDDEFKMKHLRWKYSFIASNDLFERYDTFLTIEGQDFKQNSDGVSTKTQVENFVI